MKARRIAAATMLSLYLSNMVFLAKDYVETTREAAKIYVTSAKSPEYNSIISDAQNWEEGSVSAKDLRVYYDIALTEEEQDIIREKANKYNLDFELVLSLCYVESRYDRYAFSGSSVGLMQIQPVWWVDTFAELGCTDWYSLEDNVEMGCYILNYLYKQYSQTSEVLSAYNTGSPYANNGYANSVLSFKKELVGKKYTKYVGN